jgi:peptidoglycan/LPS O-acetylase OafA/YrhL
MSTFAPPTSERVRLSEHNANISRVPYLPGLDGMRALAVVAVMIYHANSAWLPGGFLGVEMFFVISGYLITLLIIAERERTYRFSLKQFWIRRARRLLPALFTVMALVTIWTAIFQPDALGQLRGDVLAGLFYVSNWYQLWVGLGYTSEADFAPLRHLWSLAVEEQFYLLWPLVMAALLRNRGSRRIADASRWLFLAAVLISIFVALAYYDGPVGDPEQTPEAYWWLGDRPISKLDFLYISTPTRAAGLLIGAALAMVWRPYAVARGPLRGRGRLVDAVGLIALFGFGIMCWNVYLRTPSGTADPFLFQGGMFLAAVLTALVIAAVAHPEARLNRLLGGSVLLWIGTRSYGLYLYHWPIYQAIRDVAGNKLKLHEFLFAMIVTGLVTEVSYRFIETPIRTGRFRASLRRIAASPNPVPRRILIGGAATFAVLSLFAGATLATAEVKQNEVAEALEAGEEFTTSLASGSPAAADDVLRPNPSPFPATTTPRPTTSPSTVPTTIAPATSSAGDLAATTIVETLEPTTVPPTTAPPTTIPVVPASTAPPPPPPPPPPTQLGIVTDLSTVTPLGVPPTDGGLPLVALGDSVMQGAAEKLVAKGFAVDAVKSRQFSAFLPEMQAIRDNGTFGSVVVVHLGTNGSFPQASLDQMMEMLVDVPVVIFMTGKAARSWVPGNNEKIRHLPANYSNVTVIDWEVLGSQCEGGCFYDDDIHLRPGGQDYYVGVISRVLGI